MEKFNRLLESNPSFSLNFFLPFMVFFGLMFLAAILLPIRIKKRYQKLSPYRKLAPKIQNPLLFFSLIGFFLIFAGWQTIPYFSARILIILLQLCFIFWLIYFALYFTRSFPKEVILWQEEMRKLKYFPKKRAGSRK